MGTLKLRFFDLFFLCAIDRDDYVLNATHCIRLAKGVLFGGLIDQAHNLTKRVLLGGNDSSFATDSSPEGC